MVSLAIVGGGPRAVFALDAVLERGADDLDVTIFEPAARIGPGWIYADGLPDWYRINVAADLVLPGSVGFASFAEWCRGADDLSGDDLYPPRSQVGRYLAERAERQVHRLGGHAHVRERVDAVRPQDGGWAVHSGAGVRLFDEVLVVVGHALVRDPRPPGALPAYAPLRTGRRVESVAIHGAGLTALDMTLDWTEGRGGRFVPSADRPGAVVFVPGPATPRRITWSSRTGALMSTKATREVLEAYPDLGRIAEARATQLDDRVTADVVGAVAGEIADHVGAERGVRPADPLSWLTRDVEIARGLRAPDTEWARGQAWRALYPALVARHERFRVTGRAPTEGWSGFASLARRLERLAYGPPLVNAEKVLALLRADVLHVGSGPVPDADVCIDAVLAPPGVLHPDPFWSRLIADHVVERAEERRGVRVDADGTAVVGGRRVEGLAVLGRATEDVVLGNDTLNPDLHPHLRRWAARVAARITEPAHV